MVTIGTGSGYGSRWWFGTELKPPIDHPFSIDVFSGRINSLGRYFETTDIFICVRENTN